MRHLKPPIVMLAAGLLPHAPAFAQYTQNFETNSTASWTVNAGPSDHAADFFFDYSAVGIPPAPGGPGTRGMKLQANQTNGVFGGFSVTPTSFNLVGDFILSFDWWANFNGPFPGGGSGSTQLSTFGILTAGTIAQWPATPGGPDSVWFAATGDGGSSFDYRAYSSAEPTGYLPITGVYPGGTTNNNVGYYAQFGNVGAPAAQIALFPQQTGVTQQGAAGMQWHQVAIIKSNGVVTWWIDGLHMASIYLNTVTTFGTKIFFGHSDVNAASSTDPNDAALLFTLIDNIKVRPAGTRGGPALNIDINTTSPDAIGAGGGVPGNGFGAAAAQPGVWNAFSNDGGLGPLPLVGLNGAATPVTIERSQADTAGYFWDNANTSRDFEKLLDDNHSVFVGATYTVRGLRPGNYQVFTYAISPNSEFAETRVEANWSVMPLKDVGGVMPVNDFAEGVTHSMHFVTVPASGVLALKLSTLANAGSINGMQIKPALPICPADIDGSGAVNVTDLLAVIGAWGPCANPSDCPADISPLETIDNAVNVSDLLLVISLWGSCP